MEDISFIEVGDDDGEDHVVFVPFEKYELTPLPFDQGHLNKIYRQNGSHKTFMFLSEIL